MAFSPDDFPVFKLNHAMVDIETLGKKPNSVITSIGAVRFSFLKGKTYDHFKVNIDPADSKKHGLVTDKDTIDWWKSQPKGAIEGWTKDPQPLATAIQMFDDWWKEGPKKQLFWCNGLSFDPVILKSSYAALDKKVPWGYYEECDLRTIFTFMGAREGFKQKREDSGTYHDAMEDAKAQAEALLNLFEVEAF